jgi:hypothetical protein
LQRVLLVPLMLLVLAAGCGGGGSSGPESAVASVEGPDDMLKRVLTLHFKGNYRRAYDDLHPGHQALVTRDNYAYCLGRELATTKLRVRTLGMTDLPLIRDGIPETEAKEVKLRLTAVSGQMRDSWAQSFRAVRKDGRWTWILPAHDVAAYRAGRCPSEQPALH